MSKHTPGPWVYERKFYCDGDQDHEHYEIRQAEHRNGALAQVVSGNYEPLGANACLIAAAPDLLAALRDAHAICFALQALVKDPPILSALTRMETAIAKAEGR